MAAPRLIERLRRELAVAADPERARGAQAYMKSTMPFYGVSMSEMRAIARRVFADYAWDDGDRLRRDAVSLWREARFREERYAAIELVDHRRARPLQTMEMLPAYEEMIVTGAWWDLVDPIATHLLPQLLARDPRAMKKAMLAWARSDDLWKRRSAILCQIKRREQTDLDLLYACIEPSIGRKEFFLRKAIGWALRSHAYTDPDEVRRFVRENEERLAPLSVREALKNVTSGKRPGTRRPRPSTRS